MLKRFLKYYRPHKKIFTLDMLAALAVALTAVDLKKYAVFSMICYIGMGWCILLGIKPLVAALHRNAIILLVAPVIMMP